MDFDMDGWSPMAPGAWDLDIPTTLYHEPTVFDNDLSLPPAPLLVSKEWMKPKEHYIGALSLTGFTAEVKEEEVISVDNTSEGSQSDDFDEAPAPVSPHFTPAILRAPRLSYRPLLHSPSAFDDEEPCEPSPAPSVHAEGSRAPLPAGYCALGLQFTTEADALPSPPPSPSPRGRRRTRTPAPELEAEHRERSGRPEPRRACSEHHQSDLQSRVAMWRGEVAAATTVSTTLPNPSTMELAHPTDMDSLSRSSLHVRAISEELDPWSARIGRSRGRALNLPSGRRF